MNAAYDYEFTRTSQNFTTALFHVIKINDIDLRIYCW